MSATVTSGRALALREIARVAVPVSLEYVLVLALGFVNQVVVGSLGAVAIAGVGLANSVVLILTVTLGALGTSVAILVARAHGAGRRRDLDRVVTVALLLTSVLPALAALPLCLFAVPTLRWVGASADVAATGGAYLAVMAATLPFTAAAAVVSGAMRSTGRAGSSLTATVVAVLLEAVLAWSLVLGAGPLPRLGVAGAGWAALATAVLKLAVLACQAFGLHRLVSWDRRIAARGGPSVLGPLFVLAGPLALTSLLWSAGTFLYNVVAARLGDQALAAAQIVATLEGVFIVGSIGLSSAASALVGRSLGARDAAGAAVWVRGVKRAGLVSGVVLGGLYALTVLTLPVLFGGTGPEVRRLATVGILVNAVFQVVKVRNLILGAGVLPSAGDVRGVIVGDTLGAFVVGLPLAVLLGLHTGLGLAGVFLARIAEEVAKVCLFSWRLRRVRWTDLAQLSGERAASFRSRSS